MIMEKEYFDGIPESEIDWDGTHHLSIRHLNEKGFDIIENEEDEYFNSHEYIEFLTMEAYWFGSKFSQKGE